MNNSVKSSRRRVLRLGALAATVAVGAGGGCNGCGPSGSFPQQDAAAEYPIQRGSVGVSVDFADCPVTPVIQASPANGRVGEAVSLVTSTQVVDGGSISLKWTTSGDGGTFSAVGAPKTVFICTNPGPVTLTLTVSNGRCSAMQDVSFYCLAARDGGTVDGGGDAPVQDAGVGGQGGGSGSSIINKCPQSEPTSGPKSGADCAKCVVSNCSLGKAGTDGCCALDKAADQLLCVATFACLQAHESSCTTAGDPANCFCGTSGGDCFNLASKANGPCVAEVQAAAKSMAPNVIQTQWTSPASPLGRAVNLTQCMGSFCATECALEGTKN